MSVMKNFPVMNRKTNALRQQAFMLVSNVKQNLAPRSSSFDGSLVTLYGAVRALLDKGHAVVHFVSSVGGEGTSTAATEFAAMSSIGERHRVLLVETMPIAANTPYDENSVLEGLRRMMPLDSLVHKENSENFWRCNLTNNAQSISAEEMRDAYQKFKHHFDLVVVDCPPITGGHYADLVPMAADGVVMVIRAEALRPAIVAYAKSSVERLGGTILGAVLNRRKNYIPDFIYRYL